jgi:hypothetical protein
VLANDPVNQLAVQSQQDLEVYKATDVTIDIDVVDGYGHSVDVTHSTVTLVVKKTITASVVISKIAHFATPTNGDGYFTLTPSDTSTLSAGSYVYQVAHVDGYGLLDVLLPISNLKINATLSNP